MGILCLRRNILNSLKKGNLTFKKRVFAVSFANRRNWIYRRMLPSNAHYTHGMFSELLQAKSKQEFYLLFMS